MKSRYLFTVLSFCTALFGIQNTLLAGKNCSVDLDYEKIYDDFWNGEARAIQHQFEWQEFLSFWGVINRELPFIENFKIPLNPVFPESEADPRSNVYGYNKDGSLDLNGGPKKSYNRGFKTFKLRCHTAFEGKYPAILEPEGGSSDTIVTQPLAFLYPEVVRNIYTHNVPYFVERGFDIQGPDRFAKFKDQFIWTYAAGQEQAVVSAPPNGYAALRLIWEDKKKKCCGDCSKSDDVPAYVDLHATANNTHSEYFVLETFKRNGNHKNGYGYPTRIPVTTNFCRFEKLYNHKPIAFYDRKKQVLTVHVPSVNSDKYFLTRRDINTGNPALDVHYLEHLAGFDGSFKIFGFDKCGKLVPSDIKNAEVFAQVSEVVNIRSKVVQNPDNGGQTEFFELANPIRDRVLEPVFKPDLDITQVYYTGVVLGNMNGDTKAYDNYAFPFPSLNAYEDQQDPVDIPHQEFKGHRYARGNNPMTRVVEKYSCVSATTFWDFSLWDLAFVSLPLDVLKGQTSFPENVATTPVPQDVPGQDAFILINAHEFTHQTQFASGSINYLPSEAMAVGIELDTHASGQKFGPFRAGAFTQRLIRTMRGEFTAMRADNPFVASTYGMGIWWKYLQDQFDFNNQVMRRTMDVLSSDTLGPLLRKNDFPDSLAVLSPVNYVGGSAALDRALRDLFGKNLKDVWNDYSISITMLRNNTSIPAQWRHYFPYWIYNTEYDGYDKLVTATVPFGLEAFANWWEQMNDNDIIPPEFRTAYTGETFIRTLPEFFETDALSFRTFAFNVIHPSEGGPNKIKVQVPQGEWRVTLVQFTSDGTPVGSFIADGPHTLFGGDSINFNIANHSPAFSESGNIRLICVNVTFDGTGKTLSEYFTEETPNGHIIIEAPSSSLAKKKQSKREAEFSLAR